MEHDRRRGSGAGPSKGKTDGENPKGESSSGPRDKGDDSKTHVTTHKGRGRSRSGSHHRELKAQPRR